MNYIPFPSIEGFHNVVKTLEVYPHLAPNPITYHGKIKLHGTNAGVRIIKGEIIAQSRTKIITSDDDNAGFAKWVESRKNYFKTIWFENATIFGEWCGPGIMKSTAIQQIPNKIFAVFAISVGEGEDEHLITCPQTIAEYMGIDTDFPNETPSDIKVLPWYADSFVVDYSQRENLQQIADKLNKVVNEIEPCDPWVKSIFGVEGVCEGIVYYPLINHITPKQFGDLSFKAKGEKHKIVKTKEAVQIDPEVAASIDDFANMFITEMRLEQGLTAIGGSLEMKNTGLFLKWILADVIKESADELEASSLEWMDVEKAVQTAARTWFIKKNKEI